MATQFSSVPKSVDDLAPFPARFARELFARHPEWQEGLTLVGPEPPEPRWLLVTVPPPAAGRPALEIEADDEEVTIFFDRWHGHYSDWEDERAGFTRALSTIDRLVREELVVVVDFERGEWAGSHLAPPTDLPVLASGRSRYVRSWTGRLDVGAPAT